MVTEHGERGGYPGGDGPWCSVSAELERSLTEVARAILRLEVPQSALADGESVDKAGYWLLVRISREAPLRLSVLAGSVELDLSTVSRQIRDLVPGVWCTRNPIPMTAGHRCSACRSGDGRCSRRCPRRAARCCPRSSRAGRKRSGRL